MRLCAICGAHLKTLSCERAGNRALTLDKARGTAEMRQPWRERASGKAASGALTFNFPFSDKNPGDNDEKTIQEQPLLLLFA